MRVDWIPSSFSTCYFVFSTNELLRDSHVLTSQALKQEGFLPSGLFERLLARGCVWSQKTSLGTAQQLEGMLFKNVAELPYGGQRLRLMLREDINSIQLDVQGSNPLGAFHRVQGQIHTIIAECMQSLFVIAALEIKLPAGETLLSSWLRLNM